MKAINGIEECVLSLKGVSNSRIYMNVKTLTCFAEPYRAKNSYNALESARIIEVCTYNCNIDVLSVDFLKEKVTSALLNSASSYLIS